MVDLQQAQPVVALMRADVAPICFARPENPGIANVEPIQVEAPDASAKVSLTGGEGACLWIPKGEQKLSLSWKGIDGTEMNSVVVRIDSGRAKRYNICLKETAKDRFGWALIPSGQNCRYK